jgi:photosystem II stability/assembly factor-like uncharacterized protein
MARPVGQARSEPRSWTATLHARSPYTVAATVRTSRTRKRSLPRAIRGCWAVLALTAAAPLAAGNNVWTSGTPAWGPEDVFSITMSGRDGVVYARAPLGVFVSKDFGQSWTYTDLGLGTSCCERGFVTVDPKRSWSAYTDTTARGLLKTTDGGTTWQVAGSGLPTLGTLSPLVIDPFDSDTIYLGSDGVYKSEDGAKTWTRVLGGNGVTALAADPSVSGIVYAGVTDVGVVKTVDGGRNWSVASQGLPERPYLRSLVVDPLEASTIYACTLDSLFRSRDGGVHWSALPAIPNVTPWSLAVSGTHPVALWVVAFDSTGHTSVFRSADRGDSWSISYDAAPLESLYVVAASPFVPGLALVAGTDGRKTTDGGYDWSISGTPTPVGAASLLTRAGSQTVFAAGGADVVSRSDDGGRSWVPAGAGLPPSIRSVQADSTGSTIFATDGGSLFASENSGNSWELRAQLLTPADRAFGATVDPSDPETVFVWTGGSCLPFCIFSGVRVTRDRGQSWTDIAGINGPIFFKVLVAPGPEHIVYALNGQVWRGNASGLTPTGPLDRVADLAIDPSNPLRIYAIPHDRQSPGQFLRSEDGEAHGPSLPKGPTRVPLKPRF